MKAEELKKAKEWFEKNGFEYKLVEHDEGGFIGIDEYLVAEMLLAYANQSQSEEAKELKGLCKKLVELYESEPMEGQPSKAWLIPTVIEKIKQALKE